MRPDRFTDYSLRVLICGLRGRAGAPRSPDRAPGLRVSENLLTKVGALPRQQEQVVRSATKV